MTRATVTKGSGNIFRDLGFSEERSAELLLKSSLLQALQDTIRSHAWKQVEAAARLGIDQAKVSKLLYRDRWLGYWSNAWCISSPYWAKMWKLPCVRLRAGSDTARSGRRSRGDRARLRELDRRMCHDQQRHAGNSSRRNFAGRVHEAVRPTD